MGQETSQNSREGQTVTSPECPQIAEIKRDDTANRHATAVHHIS